MFSYKHLQLLKSKSTLIINKRTIQNIQFTHELTLLQLKHESRTEQLLLKGHAAVQYVLIYSLFTYRIAITGIV